MKHAKRLASLLLALTLVLAMAAPAMAEVEKGTITVRNVVEGQIYKIYRIFELVSYDKNNNHYSYKVDSAWSGFFTKQTGEPTNGLKYVVIDEAGYVTWKEGADAAAFAKAAQEYVADTPGITAVNTITASDSALKTKTETVGGELSEYKYIEFVDCDLGYYLMDSTLGVLCSLDTTNPNVTIREKNQTPTNVKTVEEGATYGSENDADIGDTVNFKSTVTLPVGSENVVFHDTMTVGLTPKEDAGEIKVYTDETMTTELDEENYTVNPNPDDGCTFEVSFTKTYLDDLSATATVYVKYSATVNVSAVIGGTEGNTNTSKLSYGDANNTKETPGSTTKTFTWKFNVFKYTEQNGAKTALEGVKFVLLNNAQNQVATIVEGKLSAWVGVPSAEAGAEINWPNNTVLTTDSQGKIEIKGLDSGTYYLKEIEALKGYNLLKDPVQVTIENDGKVNKVNKNGQDVGLENNTVEVENQSGTELPSTGGMGTTVLYVVGGILLVGAAVLLITRGRMNAGK